MTNDQIIIKIAEKKDAALIADLSRKTFFDSFAHFNTKENMDKFMNEQFTREALMAEVGVPGNIFLLAYLAGEALGYVRMRKSENPPELGDEPAIEIARIYVVKEAIGKGVGPLLLERCIEIAKERNEKIIWLGVWEHNPRAIAFYTKWGFEKFGSHSFMLGDDKQTDWYMKKNLG
ncbi:MAG: GNAT family N-acetyltransferase [Bacteroidetes bacterium]|nr:GNAT family N-acetyltransferase [Bacteroidota bacterium]